VFRDIYDTPMLVAYKKLQDMRYLALLHYSNSVFSYYTSYVSLLDTIPIKSLVLSVFLPILNNRKNTIREWYKLIVKIMREY